MDDIKSVIDKSYECLQVELTYGAFSFTLFHYLLGISLISMTIWFIKKIFL